MAVVRSLYDIIQYSTNLIKDQPKEGVIYKGISQIIGEKVYYLGRNNSIYKLKFLNNLAGN